MNMEKIYPNQKEIIIYDTINKCVYKKIKKEGKLKTCWG